MANVSLKTKKLKSGRLSYYLQYYDPDTKKRWKEYLGLYLITKPKDEFERSLKGILGNSIGQYKEFRLHE